MNSWFKPNLDARGRWIRAIGGVGCLAASIWMISSNRFWAVVLGVSGAFMLFESLRGWCALRACGIKTKY